MIAAIVCIDDNDGIGKDGQLLYRISEDMKRFKEITTGKTVIMGYNTYVSLPNGVLPDRENIVLTSKDIEIPGAIVVHDTFDESITKHIDTEDVTAYVIGGESIYMKLLWVCEKLCITHVFTDYPKLADKKFIWNPDNFEVEDFSVIKHDERSKLDFAFVDYRRKNKIVRKK